MLDPAAPDVRDHALYGVADGSGPGGAPDALLEAGLQPRQVEVHDRRGVLEVVALVPDLAQAQDRELAGAERGLHRLEALARERPVADVRLDGVALAQRGGELVQAADALGEDEHLLFAGDARD